MFIIITLNIILIGSLIWFLLKNISKLNNFMMYSIIMIISGGIGNLTDRLFKGSVIDYIDINYLFKYPIFNFADILIVTGVILIIGYLIVKALREQENE